MSDKEVTIDDADYELVSSYRWRLSNTGYAVVGMRNNGIYKVLQMHRLINATPDNMQTDHINHNTLDNRKSNLRTVTASQNQLNRVLQSNNRSGYTGVRWNKKDRRWIAFISKEGKRTHLGSFTSLNKAIMIREKARLKK